MTSHAHIDLPHAAQLQLSSADLVRLQSWFSPAFPVGSFSYSHGLEWLIETGDVHDASSLKEWIEAVLCHGSGRSDAILLSASWRALMAQEWRELEEIAALAAALQPSAERRVESLGQGSAFFAAVAGAWPHPLLDQFRRNCPDELAAPIAIGVAGAAHAIPLEALVRASLQAFMANLVSAGVRLIPLGQSAGLKVISAIEPIIDRVAGQALVAGLDEIGSAAILTDIASMRHELQYTRLFRS